MGAASTPPLPPPPPLPPASPERLMLTSDPSKPFLSGINGSTSGESFTSCTDANEQPLLPRDERRRVITSCQDASEKQTAVNSGDPLVKLLSGYRRTA